MYKGVKDKSESLFHIHLKTAPHINRGDFFKMFIVRKVYTMSNGKTMKQ